MNGMQRYNLSCRCSSRTPFVFCAQGLPFTGTYVVGNIYDNVGNANSFTASNETSAQAHLKRLQLESWGGGEQCASHERSSIVWSRG